MKVRFSENWLDEMAVNMSAHATQRAAERHGKPAGISKAQIANVVNSNEQKIIALGQRYPHLILKTPDALNIVGSLNREGGDYVFDVITVMRKQNFKPNNPYDKVVRVKEDEMATFEELIGTALRQQQQQRPKFTRPTQPKPNYYSKPTLPSSQKARKKLPKPTQPTRPKAPTQPQKQTMRKAQMTTPWGTKTVVDKRNQQDKMRVGYTFDKDVDAQGII